ncbi:MAG: gliding motility-associated C-terminal domain-containing protein [Bacteroidales bacterium]|nr:gliding motility-associated C-terminal domain-containing protein [Bacteroidales bacterium]
MKKLYAILVFAVLFLVNTSTLFSQCTNCTANFPGGTFASPTTTWTTVSPCVYGGEYSYYTVVSGNTYSWQTCGDTDFDTQLTLRQTNCTGTFLAYNDDGCGLQSTITWTATFSGTVCVLVSRFSCIDESTCMTLQWRLGSGASCADHGCSNPSVIGSLPYTHNGASTCSNCNNFDATDGCGSLFMTGAEWVYTYTPSTTGWVDVYAQTAQVSGGGYERGIGLFVLDNCPSSGGNCLASSTIQYPEFHGSPRVKLLLNAGTTYYIVVSNGPDPAVYNGDACVNYNLSVTNIAQPTPTTQDCLNAIPLCFSTYSESTAYTNSGNYPSEINSSTSCLEGERNDVWYTFTVQTTGTLGFAITPNISTDDYDWAVWNITGLDCGSVFTNAASQVSCNYSMTTGNTGPTGADTQTSAGPLDGPFNAELTVIAGETYVINVSQWTVSTGGYNIVFGGTAQVIDNTGPSLNAITSAPACGQQTITVEFTENVLCSSVAAGDFTVTGPGGPYSITSVYSSTCAAGGSYSNTYELTLNTPLTAGGSYSLNLTGSVTDICSHSTNNNSLAFTVTGVSGSLVSSSNPSCYGGSNGSATVSASGGTPGYTYSWSSGASGATANNLVNGNNYVTVTDAVGVCQAVVTVPLTQPTQITASTSTVSANCNGQSNGTATVSASGGSPGYTYSWSGGGGTGATTSGLPAGTYTVTITDSHSCTRTGSATIGQPTALTASTTNTAVACNGGNNGTATVSASGGTTGYSYAWSTGSTNATATGLSANTYTVTVTDSHGCTTSTSATVTQPTAISVTTTGVAATCNGSATGSATASVSGGTAGYSYSWNDPSFQTTATASSLAAGLYGVTVTDANGCTRTGSYTVSQPTAITATMSNTAATCGNNDGSASVVAAGGTPGYSYVWSDPSNQTTTTATNLYAGGYTVTITDSHGCTRTGTTNVNDAGSPSATIYSSTNVSCNGSCNGTAAASATGGTAPYSYAWSSSANTGTTESSLCAGTVTVTVTDNIGCISTASVTITQPASLNASITSTTNASCFGGNNGQAVVGVSGGTPAYSYVWSGGAGTTTTASGLSAGTYTVTITDANGCTISRTATISQPTVITPSISSTTNVSCNGGNNGTATVSASGGTPGYTYSWQTGYTGATVTGLAQGTYNVTVTDANSCTAVTSATITQPTILSSTTSLVNNVSCNGGSNGSASVSGVNGTSPYTYLWDASAGSQTTATATGLSSGTHYVTITDANGCTASNSITISQPQPLATTVSTVGVTCNGLSTGTATVNASGGVSPYSYLWNAAAGSQTTAIASSLAAGTYTVTVTDANSCTATNTVTVTQPTALSSTPSQIDVACFGGSSGQASVSASGGTTPYSYNWSTGGTSDAISGLIANNYSVTITDALGCTSSQSYTISQPAAITATAAVTNSNCGNNDGEVTINPTGGTAPYIYQWGAGTGYQTTQTATTLFAGSYNITVYDDHNCTYSQTVNVADIGAADVTIDAATHNVCHGDTLGYAHVAIVSGGTGPFTYEWSNHGETTDFLNNVGAGEYSVTVTDAVNCNSVASIIITEPTAISATITASNNISCYGLADGSITFTATGGTPPYTYLWDDAVSTTTATVSNLLAGTYNIVITDDNSCTYTNSGTVSQPSLLTSSIYDFDDVTCFGGNDGDALVQPSGGSSPYSYLWSNGDASSVADSLLANVYYFVTITDNRGCEKVDSVIVSEPTAIDLTNLVTTPATCDGDNGTATVTPTGGTPGYTYLWSNGVTDAANTALAYGSYGLTVTDANSCVATTTAEVISEGGGTAAMSITNPVLCNGGNSGSVMVTITGGTAPYHYEWSNGVITNSSSNTDEINALTAGSYSVSINDANNCPAVATINITQPNALYDTLAINHVACYGNNSGSIVITVSGGTPQYYYSWSNGQTNNSAINLGAGGYSVTITDSNGCSIVHNNISITQPSEALGLTIATTQPISCYGETGTLSAVVSGGSPMYSYVWDANTGTQTTSTAINLSSGSYYVTVYDANGCSVIANSPLYQPNAIMLVIDSVNNVSCTDNNDGEIQISSFDGTGTHVYSWSNGETTEDIENLTAGEYILTLTDENDCVVTDTFTILNSEIGCYDLEIPSAFTPNADGINDTWAIKDVESVENIEIEIFNRWGQLMFSFSGTGSEYASLENQWDGTYNGNPAPLGSYVYIVKLGETEEETHNGTITIIR